MLRNTAPRADIDSASLHADKSEKLTNRGSASFTATFIVQACLKCFSLWRARFKSGYACVFYNKPVTWEEPREVGKFVDGINVRLKGSSCRRSKSFRLESTCLIAPADAFARNRRDVGRTWQWLYRKSNALLLPPRCASYDAATSLFVHFASAWTPEIRSASHEISTKKTKSARDN